MSKHYKQCSCCGAELEVELRAEVGDKVKIRDFDKDSWFSQKYKGCVVPIIQVDPFPSGHVPEAKYVAKIDGCTWRLQDEYFDVIKESA